MLNACPAFSTQPRFFRVPISQAGLKPEFKFGSQERRKRCARRRLALFLISGFPD
jgi:hypothetical protein